MKKFLCLCLSILLTGCMFQKQPDVEIPKKTVSDYDGKIDLTVEDYNYVRFINDWYMNFGDYDGKVVQIEGIFLDFKGYTYIGRFGPSCPYCTNGYVSFEFESDQSFNRLTSTKDWVRVIGKLTQGEMETANHDKISYYYIDAYSVTQIEPGKDTVS